MDGEQWGSLDYPSIVKQHYTDIYSYDQLQKLGNASQRVVETSGPQGYIRPYTIIEDASAWFGQDLKKEPQKYISRWTQEDLKEIHEALKLVEKQGLHLEEITRETFQLPTVGPKLIALRNEIVKGLGIQIIKGFPIEEYNKKQLTYIFYAFGAYWGNVRPNNNLGNLVEHKRNKAETKEGEFEGKVNGALTFHCDGVDAVSLFCLKQAQSGGHSSWVSSVTIHNELLKLGRKDIVETLTKDFIRCRRGRYPWGHHDVQALRETFPLPIYHYTQGYFSSYYQSGYYEEAQKQPGVPQLTEKQKEAIRWLNSLCQSDKLRLDYTLEPGDINLVCNHQVYHNRWGYTDSEDVEDRRYVLRIWVAPPNERPLPDVFVDYFGSTQVGNRGGLYDPTIETQKVPLEAR